jgi:hypothetical protein
LTSGTLNPPSQVSVSRRGDWTQGKVQDVYFNYHSTGDHYCGRLLAGLDVNSTSFKIMPPHFTVGYEHPDVKEGIELCFDVMRKCHPNLDHLTGVLLLLLASIVYHSDFLRSFHESDQQHGFGNIKILDDNKLLVKLKALLSVRPTDNMPIATGIPTHVEVLIQLEDLRKESIATQKMIFTQKEELKDVVVQAIKDNDLVNGNTITMSFFLEKWNQLEAIILTRPGFNGVIDDGNENVVDNNCNVDCAYEELPALDGLEFDFVDGNGYPLYRYKNQYFDVPENWEIGKNPNRKDGFHFWIKGKPGNVMIVNGVRIRAPIKPYRSFKLAKLPEKLRKIYSVAWNPIYTLMLECPDLKISKKVADITTEYINWAYNKATEYLKTRVSFIWMLENTNDPRTWSIATWSRNVSYNNILLHGTESDKNNLPPLTKASKAGRKKRRPLLPVQAARNAQGLQEGRAGSRVRARTRATTTATAIDEDTATALLSLGGIPDE